MSRLSHEYPDDPSKWGGPDLAISADWSWRDVVRGSRWIGTDGVVWTVQWVEWRDNGLHVEMRLVDEASGATANQFDFKWIRRAA